MAAVLSRLVRLSYWSRVQSVVPPAFGVLLPPEPLVSAPPPPRTHGFGIVPVEHRLHLLSRSLSYEHSSLSLLGVVCWEIT